MALLGPSPAKIYDQCQHPMASKRKYSQAARVQGILRTLGVRQGITIGELAEEFGVTKRTLYRDLKALEEAGYPLLSEGVEGTTYWKLEPSFKGVSPVTFTLNELLALCFSDNYSFLSKSLVNARKCREPVARSIFS